MVSESTPASADLERIRGEIDRIDRQLQELLNRRAECAQQVAEVKKAELSGAGPQPDGSGAAFYCPEREAQALRRVMQRNSGPLPAARVADIFRA